MKSRRKFVIQIFENNIFTGDYVYHARKKYLGYDYDMTSYFPIAQIWKDKKKCDKACTRIMNNLEPWSRLKIYTLKTLEITDIKTLRELKLKRLEK